MAIQTDVNSGMDKQLQSHNNGPNNNNQQAILSNNTQPNKHHKSILP